MKIKLLILSLFLFCSVLNAQQSIKKEHYRIINPAADYTLNYEKAMFHTDVDSLRFLNERRQIPVQGSFIIIELYSANELLKAYNKPISPLTIKETSKARKIKFKLEQNKSHLTVISETR